MKRLAAFCLFAFALVARAIESPTVIFDAAQLTGLKLTNVWVQFTPLSVVVNSNVTWGRFPERFKTDVTGRFTTNIISRQYRVEIFDPRFTEILTNCVPDTNGTVYFTDHLCVAATNGFTTAYSKVQSDARYTLHTNFLAASNYLFSISGGGGGGEVTTAQLLVVSNYVAAVSNANWLVNVWTTNAIGTNLLGWKNASNYTHAVSNAFWLADSALTNLVTASTNGFIPSNAGKGTNNQWYAPMLFTATNTGDFRVTGNAVVVGSLSSSGAALGGGSLTGVNSIMLGTGTINWDGLTGNRFLRLDVNRDTVSSAYDDADLAQAISDSTDALATSATALAEARAKQTGTFLQTNFFLMGVSNIASADANGLVVRTNNGVLTLSNAMSAASGEANTASSVGNGTHLFHTKSSVDLQFNTVSNGSGVLMGSNNNVITFSADWAQIASQTNLSGVSNLLNSVSNLAYLEAVFATNWANAISNLAQTKIAINGGGGTNNAVTNATWFEKLTAGPNTNGYWTVSNSSATAVGVLHFISTNGSGPRSIWSLNLTNGDMTIAGAMSMDQLNIGTLNLTNWLSIGGPLTNLGWSFLSGVTASSVMRATNLFPNVEALTLATNANGVTNILLNITNRGALVLYPTNGLAWTNIVGFTTDAAPTLTAYVFMQAGNQTNLWPSGNLHGYRVHTNDNSTLWSTFTNNNLYIVTVTGVRSNAIFTVARFSGL
jgi:hypothetical protein